MKPILKKSLILLVLSVCAAGCMSPQVKLFTDATDPLKEFTLKGEADEKALLIPVNGIISDFSRKGFLRTEPSMVQEIVSQLDMAAKDPEIKAVLFKIDSPGGSVTASDMLYHEIQAFKEETGKTIAVSLMNVAASGGYYMSLPADMIMAHPTSITGSVGVIFLRPKVNGLMEKIGVDVVTHTSGTQKDMGSPFREASPEEERIFQGLAERLGSRFIDLVKKHRGVYGSELAEVETARIFLADEALRIGLVDEIGYLSDAFEKTRAMAGLPVDARLVVYRRTEYPNDNIYNTQTRFQAGSPSLVDLGIPASAKLSRSGFYYLWPAGIGFEE